LREASRAAAHAIWRAALAAGNVGPLVDRALGRLSVDPSHPSWRHVFVFGCGKASGAMAAAVERTLGRRITEGLVVVKDGYTVPTARVVLREAGHPVPDARGQAAAEEIVRRVRPAGADDAVLFLVSGGGSALTPAPVRPITLAEKQETTRLLLGAGATINELNAVRKHVSLFKGGQLARAAAPATLISLILSDVIGDPLDVIASGPTAPDPTTFAEALAVLERRGVGYLVSNAVRARLEAGARGEVEETPKPGDRAFERVTNVVIGNNALVVAAAAVGGWALLARARESIVVPPAAPPAPTGPTATTSPTPSTASTISTNLHPQRVASHLDTLGWTIQLAAYASLDKALAHADRLAADAGVPALVTPAPQSGNGPVWYRVLAGSYATRAAAGSARAGLWRRGIAGEGVGDLLLAPYSYHAPAGASLDTLRRRGLPAVRWSNGVILLGAFEAPEQAAYTQAALKRAGVRANLLPRMGAGGGGPP